MQPSFYPIGTPGVPWGDAEIVAWLGRQQRRRSYADEVLTVIDRLRDRFDVVQYGELDYAPDTYPLFALRSRDWSADRPVALVTGGVHGYETSGVHGALRFADRHAVDYAGRLDLMIVPCVSPWGYERIHRWNPRALDPNRSFRPDSPAPESAPDHPLAGSWIHHSTSSCRKAFAARRSEAYLTQKCRSGGSFVATMVPGTFQFMDLPQ